MEKFSDLQEKEVINICDGRRLGFVGDLELDIPSGKIRTLIIPVEGCRWNPFGRGRAYYIPWRCIRRIGDDIILVEVDADSMERDETPYDGNCPLCLTCGLFCFILKTREIEKHRRRIGHEMSFL